MRHSRKLFIPHISTCVSLSAEGGMDSGQGSSVFSSDSPHLGQLTMSYSCPPSSQPPSQPHTPYPLTPSANTQQHPGYAQPPQPMVSAHVIQIRCYCMCRFHLRPSMNGVTLTDVLNVTRQFEVSAASCFGVGVSLNDISSVCEWVRNSNCRYVSNKIHESMLQIVFIWRR